MKRIIFFCSFVLFYVDAHTQNYNVQGDLALQRKDYQEARTWFSEGLEICDQYSIRKLTEIWKERVEMRNSMRLSMRKCFKCLIPLAETKNQEATLMISDYYKSGIGVETDSIQSEYWLQEYGKLLGFTTPEGNLADSAAVDLPQKRGLFPLPFRFFVAYTYSVTMPVGITIGFFDKFGGYLSFRTDLNKGGYTYTCNNKIAVEIPTAAPLYRFDRELWNSSMITGGIMLPVKKNIFFSAGAGYGKRELLWDIVTDTQFSTGKQREWCLNTETSYKGYAVETGAMFIWKHIIISAGINTTKFKDFDAYFGLGYYF